MTDQDKKQNREIEIAKDVELYAAMTAGWINTMLERDKSLITLSAGGVGLLITLISTVGVKTQFILILYIAGLIAFVICLLIRLGEV